MFTAHCSLLTVYRLPFTAHRSPLTVHRSPLTAHWYNTLLMPIGTLINALAIMVGSVLGTFLHKAIPDKIKAIVFQALGLASLVMGVQMALKLENILALIFSLLIGGIAGELLDLEGRLEKLGDLLKGRMNSANQKFTEGFVAASLLFTVGAMSTLGAINEGISGDRSLLMTKSLLDAFASLAFASTYGIGVLFSFLPVVLYEGSITLLAAGLQGILTTSVINQLTAVGGVMIMGIGFNLLEIKRIKVTNLLPALVVVVLLALLIK